MTEAAVRTRTRLKPVEVDERLPLSVTQYMIDSFPGTSWPSEPEELLRFIQTCFSNEQYVQVRHHIIDRCRRAGWPLPRIAATFDRSERTVKRWVAEMKDYFADFYTMQDVRDIHVERMRDIDLQFEEVQKILLEEGANAFQKMQAIRTSVRLHAMKDQILREAGYYRAFDVNKLTAGDVESERDADEFARDLDTALLDEVPMIEGDYEREGESK